MTAPSFTSTDLIAAARDIGIGELTEAEVGGLGSIVGELIHGHAFVDATDDYLPNASTATRPFSILEGADNRNNSWSLKCSIRETGEGKLVGKRIAIKDSIMVAGVPMLSGGVAVYAEHRRGHRWLARRRAQGGIRAPQLGGRRRRQGPCGSRRAGQTWR
ncbi:hypothetical protein [Paraburkholderia sp. GAS32]|uniref:hypothetical protein n=1 Tax=Paraburkholderia sp. GAS32 TaxID=3035129 RepID=UPI003D1ACE81